MLTSTLPSLPASHYQADLKLAQAEAIALSAPPEQLRGAVASMPASGKAGEGFVVPQVEAPSLCEAVQAGDMETLIIILKAGGSADEADKVTVLTVVGSATSLLHASFLLLLCADWSHCRMVGCRQR